MAKLSIIFDDSSFQLRTSALQAKMVGAKLAALRIVANELLRLSQLEVPFVTGELMNSGVARQNGEAEYIVAYNKVYAAKMHEHPEYNFHNGRKGKYLEDPMKINREIFTEFFGTTVKSALGIL